jgi:hypothetical protein
VPNAKESTVTPQAAATEYLRLAAFDESNGTHAAMAFAIDYESALCQSEDDFGIYLRLIGAE